MANTTAFTYNINPLGSGAGENNLVNQSSPCWVLTFVRWDERDTLRTNPTSTTDYRTVREPLIVENDCIQVSTVSNKNTLTPSMTATLLMTDVNYETEVAPGDFVVVNMLNWEHESRRVAKQARASSSINGANDGFKGVYKVQSVRTNLAVVDQSSGTVGLIIKITGFAFTEFNNTVYFNQNLIDQSEQNNVNLWFTNFQNIWAFLVTNKGLTNIQDILRVLIEMLIGNGLPDSATVNKNGIIRSPNTLFYIPGLLGQLLGVDNAVAAKDIYNYLFGIQNYNNNASQSLASGMNPYIASTDGRFIYTNGGKCQGDTVNKPEYWNQVQVWSILNQFTNSPLNELYTCFRISPTGQVMPTLVFRQIPFNNDDFNSNLEINGVGSATIPITKFMNIPRWNLFPSLVYNMDIGRDESARINFVQYFGRSTFGPEGYDVSSETAQKNYLYDIDDVKRSGLRPYVVTTLFDEPVVPKAKGTYRSIYWARILGDCLIGGQLKMNGTIECVGIYQPIAVGDNLQFNGVIYHIEQVTHSCFISPADGRKKFTTTLSLSHGISIQSSSLGVRYSEMFYSDAYKLRNADYRNNQILPGVSESQDVIYRNAPSNPDTPHGGGVPFQQPNTNASINSPKRNGNSTGENT